MDKNELSRENITDEDIQLLNMIHALSADDYYNVISLIFSLTYEKERIRNRHPSDNDETD